MSDAIPPNPMRSGTSVSHQAAAGEAGALRQRARNDTLIKSGMGVPLPGGIVVPVEAFSGITSLPTRDVTKYLAHPEIWIIANPNPGSKYVWGSRDEKYGGDMTSAAIRATRYRPVKKTEIKDAVDFDLHFKTGTGTNQYVCWRDLMLCEVPEEYAKAQYDGPVGDYLRHLGVLQDAFKSDAEKQSRGLAVGSAEAKLVPG